MEHVRVQKRTVSTGRPNSPLLYAVAMVVAAIMAVVAVLLIFGGMPPVANEVFAPAPDATSGAPDKATIPRNAETIGLPPAPTADSE